MLEFSYEGGSLRFILADPRAAKNHKEGAMYATDVIWWAYTAFLVLAILFMLLFAWKVREKGG
jgi:hypothetical protein